MSNFRKYRIYYANDGFREYAGILRQSLNELWSIRFKNGYQYYCPGFEGAFDACVTYLQTCFHGGASLVEVGAITNNNQ